MRTAWGYDVSGKLEPLLTPSQFAVITGNAYLSNPRVESALKAASQAIRNYCGWHICPELECVAEPKGSGRVKRLPAAYVSEVTSVTESGEELPEDGYEWRKDGLIRRKDKWSNQWGAIEVTYTAGYDVEAVPDLAEAVAAITAGVLSVSAGVASESADGVSISYSQSASSIAASLTAQQRNALEPYKVVSSHAA